MRPLLTCAALLALAGFLFLRTVSADRALDAGPATMPAGAQPRGDVELLEVVPFALDEPFVHEWREERPMVTSGYLLALRADAELVRTRQTYEPVLYVGDQTAERCNAPLGDTVPGPDGRAILIALVPAPLDSSGRVRLDLAQEPIWFGGLELPERVDATRIAQERRRAREAGIGPARLPRTLPVDPVRAHDRLELEATYLVDLVERWCPEEVDRIATLRLR